LPTPRLVAAPSHAPRYHERSKQKNTVFDENRVFDQNNLRAVLDSAQTRVSSFVQRLSFSGFYAGFVGCGVVIWGRTWQNAASQVTTDG
jgi:hypothetical protein